MTLILHLFGEFEGKDLAHLEQAAADDSWNAPPKTGAFDGDEVIAKYLTGSYEGEAIGFLFKDGKVLQFQGSHCSCNGLEGMDELKEVTPQYIRKALAEKHYSLRAYDDYDAESVAANDAFAATLLELTDKYFPASEAQAPAIH